MAYYWKCWNIWNCVKHYWILQHVGNFRMLISLFNQIFMNCSIIFLDRDNKTMLATASFFLIFRTFIKKKQGLIYILILRTIIATIISLYCYETNNWIVLFTLLSRKAINKSLENSKLIKNTLPSKSRNSENLTNDLKKLEGSRNNMHTIGKDLLRAFRKLFPLPFYD